MDLGQFLGDSGTPEGHPGMEATIAKRAKTHILNLLTVVRNIRIQTRLFGSFVILSLIPLLVTGIFSYSRSSDAMKSKISTYSVQIDKQVSENIQSKLSSLENDSVDISISDIVQQTLSNYQKMGDYDRHNAQLIMQESVVKKFSFLHDVSDVLLYTDDMKRIIAYGDDNMFNFVIEPLYLGMRLNEARDRKGAPLWTVISRDNEVHLIDRGDPSTDKHYGILVIRSIKDLTQDNQSGYRSNGKQIGYIVIRADEKYVSDVYSDINIGYGADMFVMNSEGKVISSRSAGIEISKEYKNGFLSKYVKNSQNSSAITVKLPGDKDSSLVAFSPIKNTDWYVVSVIPFSYLNSESENTGKYTFVIGIVCFFLAVILSFFISKSISHPLRKLISSMNKAKKGDLTSGIKDESRDEIAEVTSNYNDMLADIKELLENVKNKENQKRIAELKTLQAQVNPHFLSNTLNTVKWLAGMQNAANIENLITALIDLLHASIVKGNELITLREEIEYLKNYIFIQEFKYCDKFDVRIDIEEETMELKVLKFLLQPLVENSIIHGIEPLEGKGLISVKAFIMDGCLKIKIMDNGVGIPADAIKSLLSEDTRASKSKFSGIGVSNVRERIKLFFGDDFGICIESIPYLLTTMELTLPIMKGNV